MKETEIKELLINNNAEFKRIYDEHQNYEKELDKFKEKHYLTNNEEILIKEIKKKKLRLKDKMQAMIENYEKKEVKN
jgi:uncharacterized protein YdcH (DUF465 family)